EAIWNCAVVRRGDSHNINLGAIRVSLKAINSVHALPQAGSAPVEEDEDDEDDAPTTTDKRAAVPTAAHDLNVGDVVVQIDGHKMNPPVVVRENETELTFDRNFTFGLSQTFYVDQSLTDELLSIVATPPTFKTRS